MTVEEPAAAVTHLNMPYLGDGAGEADILKVMVAEGDEIAIEQPVIEIETDKATVEVPSDLAGKVLKLLVTPGQQISSGDAILEIAARPASDPAPSGPATPAPGPAPTPGPQRESAGPAGAGYGAAPRLGRARPPRRRRRGRARDRCLHRRACARWRAKSGSISIRSRAAAPPDGSPPTT